MDGEQTVEDFVEDLKAAMSAREMSRGEKLDFIASHLEGAARLFPKRSLPQLLKLFYERRQRDGESLRAYSHSLRELLDRALKVDKKAVVDPNLTLRDQFANSVRAGVLRKELRKFIHEHPSITFLASIEEALQWSEEEKPWRSTHESSSREVTSDIVQPKECNSSTASTPLQQVLDVLLKQQQSIEDLTKTMQAMRSVEPHPIDRSCNHRSAKPVRGSVSVVGKKVTTPVTVAGNRQKGSQCRTRPYQTVRSLTSQTSSPCHYEPGDRTGQHWLT